MTVTTVWMELNIDRTDDSIRVSARGSRGEQIAFYPFGKGREALAQFASAVARAARLGKPFDSALLSDAQAMQRAVLGEEADALLARLRESSRGPVILRFMMHDNELQGIPWEALCNTGEALGFWATSPHILPVRGVTSADPWEPREIQSTVRILAIAPTGSAGLANLKQALEERISGNEVEWLDPIEGHEATKQAIFERLRREPIPHVVHFLGHGGIDNDLPALRMADDEDGEATWLPVELLAQQLGTTFRSRLRLVVLEACDGAKPSAFASAAEILARSGADAVVAHLWPVRADVARTCSMEFYRALVGGDRTAGDVAIAMNEARRAMVGSYDVSAEALSPVLYLRGPNGKIFDFVSRGVRHSSIAHAPVPAAVKSPLPAQPEPPPAAPPPAKNPEPATPVVGNPAETNPIAPATPEIPWKKYVLVAGGIVGLLLVVRWFSLAPPTPVITVANTVATAPLTPQQPVPKPTEAPAEVANGAAPDPVCPEGMLRIPKGTLEMGVRVGENGKPGTDNAVRQATVDSFCLDRTEVTVRAYAACVESKVCNPAHTTVKGNQMSSWVDASCNAKRLGHELHPINCVDWRLASSYCAGVNKRLPSDDEWEYAGRGTDKRIYPWGNEDPHAALMNGCGNECAALAKKYVERWPRLFKEDDGFDDTAPVGSYPADISPFGMLDMGGNVSEWTSNGSVRGGDWMSGEPHFASVTHVEKLPPLNRDAALGFRCAK